MKRRCSILVRMGVAGIWNRHRTADDPVILASAHLIIATMLRERLVSDNCYAVRWTSEGRIWLQSHHRRSGPKMASVTCSYVARCRYGIARAQGLLPRSPEPRRSLRRSRLRGLHLDRHLLPADLPHAPSKV